MIKGKLLLCCDNVIVDKRTNNVSIFNLYELFSPQMFPFVIPRFSILDILEKDNDDPNEIEISFKISIGEQTIVERSTSVNFKQKNRIRNIIQFGGMPVPQPGTLNIEFSSGGVVVQSYQIIIKEPQEPQIITSH
jgi:hypothetical protein